MATRPQTKVFVLVESYYFLIYNYRWTRWTTYGGWIRLFLNHFVAWCCLNIRKTITFPNMSFVVVTSFSDSRRRIFIKSHIWLVMMFFVLFYFLQWKPLKNQENDAKQRARQPAWELISDPRTKIFIKSQASRELWVFQVNFRYGFLLTTIRKSPPGSSGSSRSIFLMVSY